MVIVLVRCVDDGQTFVWVKSGGDGVISGVTRVETAEVGWMANSNNSVLEFRAFKFFLPFDCLAL